MLTRSRHLIPVIAIPLWGILLVSLWYDMALPLQDFFPSETPQTVIQSESFEGKPLPRKPLKRPTALLKAPFCLKMGEYYEHFFDLPRFTTIDAASFSADTNRAPPRFT